MVLFLLVAKSFLICLKKNLIHVLYHKHCVFKMVNQVKGNYASSHVDLMLKTKGLKTKKTNARHFPI